jgi:Apea-like HEPN
MSIDGRALEQVESTLGLDLVSYCTASSKEDVSARFKGEKLLSAPAETVLTALANLCAEVVRLALERNIPTDMLWDFLIVFDAEKKTTLANALRREAGGQVPQPKNEDRLVEKLQQIAVNIFPVLLIPPASHPAAFGISMTRPLMSYPETPLTTEAILSDPDLTKMIPRPDGVNEADNHFNSLMSRSLIENVIGYAFNMLILDLRTLPSVDDLCREIPNSVAIAKALLKGKRVTVPFLIGLANVKLPAGAVIESAAGRLSEYLSVYDRWSPGQLREKRTTAASDRGQHEFNGAGNIVLRKDQRVRLKMTPVGPESGPSWSIAPVNTSELATAQSTILLAATLGIEHDPPIALYPTWQISFYPVIQSFTSEWSVIEQRGIAPLCALSEEETASWNDWISRITTIGLKGVEVAARRLQLAIAERRSPVDRFVDSIIAWENLYGSGGAMTLRISASLALLLGENADHRKQIYDDAKTLYALRGKVVHGTANVADSEIDSSAKKGIRVAIDALRKIYAELPDMIPFNGQSRSEAMILQQEPPGPSAPHSPPAKATHSTSSPRG